KLSLPQKAETQHPKVQFRGKLGRHRQKRESSIAPLPRSNRCRTLSVLLEKHPEENPPVAEHRRYISVLSRLTHDPPAIHKNTDNQPPPTNPPSIRPPADAAAQPAPRSDPPA